MFIQDYKDGLFTYKDGIIYRNFKKQNNNIVPVENPIPSLNKCKQGYVRLYYKNKVLKVHRLVYAIHYGVDDLFSHQCIDHIDGNKSNNNINNLRGLTIRDNTLEAEKLGLYKRTHGKINGMCKLTEDEINTIKCLYSMKIYNQYNLANIFNISQGHVSEIINGKKRRFG